MAHEVESAAIHGTAWHNAGKRLDHLMTVEEALHESGLDDWMLKLTPAVTFIKHRDIVVNSAGNPESAELMMKQINNWQRLERATIAAGGWLSDDIAYIPIDRFGHFRTKDWTLLGDVGKDYRSIDNEFGFDVFKLLCDKDGLNVAKIQSAGSLRSGKRVWVLLSLKDSDLHINGARLIPYLLYWNAHDGSSAAHFQLTTVNVVCMNTLGAALGEKYADLAVSVRHTGDIQAKMAEVQNMMAQATTIFGNFERIGNELDAKVVPQEALNEFMNFLYPPLDETKTTNKQIANRNTKILLLSEAIKQEVALLPQYTATGGGEKQFSYWTLLQGITRYTTHMQGVRVGNRADGEARFESQIIGAGAEFNAKSAKKIMELAEVK